MRVEEQMDMLFDALLRVVREFSSAEFDLTRAHQSWIVGQLRLEIDTVDMDFEGEIEDEIDDSGE